MSAIRHACQALVLVVLASPIALAKEPAKPAAAAKTTAAKVSFQGVVYERRTTVKERSDYMPATQPGDNWRDRMTIIVREDVTTPEQLSNIAGNLFGLVSDLGEVVQTDSMPNPKTKQTEHFFAAKMQGKDYTQAAFVRLGLYEGKGVLVMYSHRSFGPHNLETSTGWMDRNGEATQQKLMSWTGLPKLAQLKALPQSK